jgi:hypothetical protein
MNDNLEYIAAEWRERAKELAAWVMRHMVNRTDVWGRYVRKRGSDGHQALTVPFKEERGKSFLDESSLEKHFKVRTGNGVLGLHSASPDQSSRWLAFDIDLHDADDLSISSLDTFGAARQIFDRLRALSLDPLLMDSNGIGGFHVLAIFDGPKETRSVNAVAKDIADDYEALGLDHRPEVFPGKPRWEHYGDWLRLFGRHHSREHYTRVWNDEPLADDPWLVGHDAIDRILATQLSPGPPEIESAKRTLCLDFDGVIHSYTSGWCGADIIPDPPIHGTAAAIERLRKSFRIVVHSPRCRTLEGRTAIENWLKLHGIVVDEVVEHKPPAFAYVDDRAIPFTGGWESVIPAIHDFLR